LQCGDDVAVSVHGQADLAVAENLHDYTRVHTLGEQQRGTRVTEVVEAKMWQVRPPE
jgi:hypothetical protein